MRYDTLSSRRPTSGWRTPLLTALLSLATLLAGEPLGAQTTPIHPSRSDIDRIGLSGPVMQVVEVARSWSPDLERWNPLVQTTAWSFTPKGQLRHRLVTLQNRPVDRNLFVYDSISGRPEPIAEVSVSGGTISRAADPISESIYTYDENDRLKVAIERNFRTGETTVTQHVYDTKGRLKLLVTSDSADGYISRIEEFYWMAEDLPTGSTIRRYDRSTDPFRSLEDTARVPERRVARDYTSYGYADSTYPVIWFSWELGRDTIVDRQEVRKFNREQALFSSLLQRYEKGRTVGMQARIYNPFGDILSAADSFGDERTYERAFDYIYDERDEQGNWQTKRQYVALNPEEGASSDRVLLSRVDRTVRYY